MIRAFQQHNNKLKISWIIIDVKPKLNCDHTWALWFHDPDGNRIEVHQYTERSFELIGRN